MSKVTTGALGVLLALVLFVFSCDPRVEPTSLGKMRIAFDNVMGTSDLSLNTGTYQNAAGESFTLTKLNYFVSNIRLHRADGSEYVVPQDSSYFLIRESTPASQVITLSSVPIGNYTGVTFLMGVDSLRSLADITLRTGVLDPALNDGMYWDWNSGYIFLKMEGTSSLAPATQNNTFFYHIGGFGGGYDGKKTLNNLRTITVSFKNDIAAVQTDKTPSVRLTIDAMKLFNGTTKLSIAQHPSVMFDTYSTTIADNYAQMFSYDRMLANP